MFSHSQFRPAQLLACFVLIIWITIRGVIPGWTTLHSDFSNYYVSARLVLEGSDLGNLYNNDWFHQQMVYAGANTPGKFAPFPPITSWVMVPVAWLPPMHAQRAFMIVNLVFILACAYSFKKVSGWSTGSSLLVILGSGASLVNNIAFGQLYLILTTLLLLAIIMIEREQPWPAGIILGITTAIKYFPIVVIVALAALSVTASAERRRKHAVTILSFSLTLSLLILAQFVFFGTNVMAEYFTSAFIPHLSSDLKGQGMYSLLFQSWDSLGRNLFVYDPVENPHPWMNWPSGRLALKTVVMLLVAMTTMAVLYANRLSPDRLRIFIAIISLAAMVMLPASATYHFVLLLLPIALLMKEQLLAPANRWIIIMLFVAIGFIPYSIFFGLTGTVGILAGYPRLLLTALLFVVTSWSLVRATSLAPA